MKNYKTILKLRVNSKSYTVIFYKVFPGKVNSCSWLNFPQYVSLPVGIITRDPVHLRVWDILQVWVDGFPVEVKAVNTIFWSHNNMCTLSKMELNQNISQISKQSKMGPARGPEWLKNKHSGFFFPPYSFAFYIFIIDFLCSTTFIF